MHNLKGLHQRGWYERTASLHSDSFYIFSSRPQVTSLDARPKILEKYLCARPPNIYVIIIINVKNLNSLKQCLTATRPTSHN